MTRPLRTIGSLFAIALSTVTLAGAAGDDDFVRFPRAACASASSPPPLHCPDRDCSPAVTINPGAVVEMETRRTFFLDYPCDLKRGEAVTFVLSLHGGGSYANWQRHYFPLLDFVETHRLVVATPSSPTQVWTEADDRYLENIVRYVYDQLGEDGIGAFWLAGHSQGGQTSNRLLMTDFFRERLDGWVSLSGGRLGSKRSDIRAPIPGAPPLPPAGDRPAGGGDRPAGAGASPTAGGAPLRLAADASVLPEYPFSHIYSSGEHELTSAGLPPGSLWADKLGCGKQTRGDDVVDTKGGYVYDTRVQPNRNPVWGRDPGPGSAEVYHYPGCRDGRVVADVIRMDKGHTEGFEPAVTEAIVKMMKAAASHRP